MKSLKLTPVLALALMLAGCATGDWRAEEVPYPAATPFDSNPFARRAYLDGFASGYQSAKQGVDNVEMIAGSHRQARRLGYYAGAATARAAAPSAPAR